MGTLVPFNKHGLDIVSIYMLDYIRTNNVKGYLMCICIVYDYDIIDSPELDL